MGERPEDLLRFNPRSWWDPVPPWVLDQLDRSILVDLAAIHLEAQITVLESQVKAAQRTLDIIQKGR
jgi:hypothetical protein